MSDALFPEADAYQGDPVHPGIDVPTPPSIVATLTRPDREARVRWLIDQAYAIYDGGLAEHVNGREVIASCVLFSGGNDSTTLAHLFRSRATHAVMANTTIGSEETRQYVRDTCKDWGLPLVEERPPNTYRELVLGQVKTKKKGEDVWRGGFPGGGAHGTFYQRLKERCFDQARHTLGFANSRTKAGVYIAGRRRLESDRRGGNDVQAPIPLNQADGSVIWVSPLANWSKLDMNTYRLMSAAAGDPVPTNWVADLMHMSMECLCGAYAHPGELAEVRQNFPHIADEIEALQDEVRAAGIVPDEWAVWGHGLGKPPPRDPDAPVNLVCGGCDDRYQMSFDLEDGAA